MAPEEITVDARGLSCPMPQLRAVEAIKALKRGVIYVLTDEQAACESVVRAAQTLELAFSVEEEGGEQVVKITKDEELWLLRE